MRRHSSMESFPRYENYLNQIDVWPSESSGATVDTEDMVARYAASALQKLLRWAALPTTRVALNISDLHGRVEYVKQTPLAQKLAAVASSDVATPVVPRDHSAVQQIVPSIFQAITSLAPELPMQSAFDVSVAIGRHLETGWTFTPKSR
jgi:hypothetical protein